jgi:hypothetical protein
MILKVTWNEFENNIKEIIQKGNELICNFEEKEYHELDEAKSELNQWKTNTCNYLIEAFGVQKYAIEFRNTRINTPSFGVHTENFNNFKKEILSKIEYLEYNTKIVSVGDLNVKPDKINIEQRKSFDTEETLNILLEKLYELYDDEYYPINSLLHGNGIELKRLHEDREYAELLKNLGFANITNDAEMYAQLTIEGKIYVENLKKSSNINYDKIDISQEEMNRKVDEVLHRFQKLDFGQEILHEEIEELKELYKTLNKKSWGQILKGKLIDLGYAQVINQEMATEIFKELTSQVHRIS